MKGTASVMENVVVIGCGLAGLGAAWRLEKEGVDPLIFEMESRPGGLCRTEREGDFLFDYTGHLLHFRNDIFKDIVFSLMGEKLNKRNRSAWIYSKNVYTRYPFQANLYGLPVDVAVECIYEYSKQYFSGSRGEAVSFADWIEIHFGKGIAEHFMIPYNSKLYRRHPAEMTPDCTGRFVPSSDLKLLLKGALSDNSGSLGYNTEFYYPDKGGIETLVGALCTGKKINLGEKVTRIDIERCKAYTSLGQEVSFDGIISTQPLPELVVSMEDGGDLRERVLELKHVSVLNVNVGVRGSLGERHWVYVPEEEFLFHRIGFTHNFSDHMAPEGCSSVYLEISYDPVNGIDRGATVERCIEDMRRMGLISGKDDIEAVNIIDIPYAYVIFDNRRINALEHIRGALERMGIYSAGRFGSWEYLSMEDAFMDGWTAAEKMLKSRG